MPIAICSQMFIFQLRLCFFSYVASCIRQNCIDLRSFFLLRWQNESSANERRVNTIQKNKAKNIKKLSTILNKSMAPLLEELKMTSSDAHKHFSLQRKHTF